MSLLRPPALRQSEVVERAYAGIVRAQVETIMMLNRQIEAMQHEVTEHFGQHLNAEIYASQPGLGVALGCCEPAGRDTTQLFDSWRTD